MSDNKKDDYGYFATGIDGYVHYKQAFDQSFHEDNGVTNEPAKQAPSRHTELQDKETSKKNEQPAPSTPSSHEKEDLFLRWISFIQKNNKLSCRQRANVRLTCRNDYNIVIDRTNHFYWRDDNNPSAGSCYWFF